MHHNGFVRPPYISPPHFPQIRQANTDLNHVNIHIFYCRVNLLYTTSPSTDKIIFRDAGIFVDWHAVSKSCNHRHGALSLPSFPMNAYPFLRLRSANNWTGPVAGRALPR